MCDYSLHDVASRPARVGDKLVSTRFQGTSTRGFAAETERDVAVCLLPGTELAFEREVRVDTYYGSGPAEIIAERVARFTQIGLDEPRTHHDALAFPDGRVVCLTNLCEGQRALVLQLPSKGEKASEAVAAPVEASELAAAFNS